MADVTVNLDRRRLLRRGGSVAALEVGPGLVSIPERQARKWGLAPVEEPAQTEAQPADEPNTAPFEDYDSLNVSEIMARLEGATDEERAAVRAYEAAGKNRKGIVEALG